VGDSHAATLNFWPASPLPASIVHQLQLLDVDVRQLRSESGLITPYITKSGQIGLELIFYESHCGLTGLEAVLATLRLGSIRYTAWDSHGAGTSFDPTDGAERRFPVLHDGEPVITEAELDPLPCSGSATDCIVRLRRRLGPQSTTPPFAGTLEPQQVKLTIHDDDLFGPEPTPDADARYQNADQAARALISATSNVSRPKRGLN
jgi:hypothetical protein